MRIKDVKPLKNLIFKVQFEETKEGLWEIKFFLNGGLEDGIKITKHEPNDEVRTWANIDTALKASEEFFGEKLPQLLIVKHKNQD